MAKLHREMGNFQEAESQYKTIYIRSESDGLDLNSAYAAVDLGNLYFENDDDFLAECWYRKAAKLFARENNQDGIMLVNSNLLNILYAKGGWLEADKILRAILAWDAEKRLQNSSAIDYLNWANLETLRLHDDHALKLVEQAARSSRTPPTARASASAPLSGAGSPFLPKHPRRRRCPHIPGSMTTRKSSAGCFARPPAGAARRRTRPVQDARPHPFKKNKIRGPEAAAEKIPQSCVAGPLPGDGLRTFAQGEELFLLRILVHGFRTGPRGLAGGTPGRIPGHA